MSANFTTDLGESREWETIFSVVLEDFNFSEISTSQDLENFPDWDVKGFYNGKEQTFEVKFDRKAAHTGNACIEYGKNYKGKFIPTGLRITKAIYWVQVFPDLPNFYILPVAKLKRLISENKFKRLLGGDGGNYWLCLIPRDLFISQCCTMPKPVQTSTGIPVQPDNNINFS